MCEDYSVNKSVWFQHRCVIIFPENAMGPEFWEPLGRKGSLDLLGHKVLSDTIAKRIPPTLGNSNLEVIFPLDCIFNSTYFRGRRKGIDCGCVVTYRIRDSES